MDKNKLEKQPSSTGLKPAPAPAALSAGTFIELDEDIKSAIQSTLNPNLFLNEQQQQQFNNSSSSSTATTATTAAAGNTHTLPSPSHGHGNGHVTINTQHLPQPSSASASTMRSVTGRQPTMLKKTPKNYNFIKSNHNNNTSGNSNANNAGQGHTAANSSNDDVGAFFNRRGEVSAEVLSALKKDGQKKAQNKMSHQTRKLLKAAVDQNKLFVHLNDSVKEECIDSFLPKVCVKNEYLIEQGDPHGDLFYVLESGTCDALKIESPEQTVPRVVASYGPGGAFGELALLFNEPRAASIIVTSDEAIVWCLDRKTYKSVQLQFKIMRQQLYEESLKRLAFMKHLSTDEISRLLDAVEEVTFKEGEMIMQEGERGDRLYIILEGEVNYSQKAKGFVGTSKKGDFFGEAALSKDEVRAATVTAMTKVTCMSLTRQKLEESIGSLEELLKVARPVSVAASAASKEGNFKHQIAMKFEDLDTHLGKSISSTNKPRVTVGGSSFQEDRGTKQQQSSSEENGETTTTEANEGYATGGVLRRRAPSAGLQDNSANSAKGEIVLGVGTFGKVIIVKHKFTGKTYAMKRLNKSWIVENCLEQHVIDERNVMTMTDHPFILKLHNSYWSDRYVYLVLELCLGGELFTYLRRLGHFTEQQSRFYIASIVEAFAHLHQKMIAYRDLKPENLMLDAEGYLKMVDFGLAKIVRNRTWTLCGTPEYLAPEIVLSKGHNKAVDYWALGVLVYELVTGAVPFTGEDNMEIFQKIIDNNVAFPSTMTPPCKDIIRGLMRTSQLSRFGNTRAGIQLIRDHSWFTGYDWAALLAKTLTPPIVPKVANSEDVSNFEAYPVEEDNKEEAPVCDWRPSFPYEIHEGKTMLVPRRLELE